MKGLGGSVETRRRFRDSYGLFLAEQRIDNNGSLEISDYQKRLYRAHDNAFLTMEQEKELARKRMSKYLDGVMASGEESLPFGVFDNLDPQDINLAVSVLEEKINKCSDLHRYLVELEEVKQ